jgi:pre-mRNA 3'-end-processing factor FIP1
MDIDEDDDFYAPEESVEASTEQSKTEQAHQSDVKPEQEDEDLEEGEEEDEAGSEGTDSVRLSAEYRQDSR